MNKFKLFNNAYREQLIRESDIFHKDDDLLIAHHNFKILDQLFERFKLTVAELAYSSFIKFENAVNFDCPNTAEDIAQWLVTRHGKEGSEFAYQLRQWLVKKNLAIPATLFNFAHQTLIGECCTRDPVYAHQLIEKVLQSDCPPKLRNLALVQAAINCVTGEAILPNSVRAISLLAEASRSGCVDATFNLGLYFAGRFVDVEQRDPVNLDLAACFYNNAYKDGHIGAQTNLALLHIRGSIHNSNPDTGWRLLNDARDMGDLVAAECIRQLKH